VTWLGEAFAKRPQALPSSDIKTCVHYGKYQRRLFLTPAFNANELFFRYFFIFKQLIHIPYADCKPEQLK
jgi:hypothetical protein